MGLESLLTKICNLGADCLRYNNPIYSNNEMVSILRQFCRYENLEAEKEMAAIRSVDRKYFAIRDVALKKHFQKVNGISLDSVNNETKCDVEKRILAMPYYLDRKVAIDETAKYFNDYVYFDFFMLKLLDVKKEDNIAVIADKSGYLSSLIAQLAKNVTLFEIFPDLIGLPEKNLRDANVKNCSCEIIGSNFNFLKPYDAGFDKVISLIGLTKNYLQKVNRLSKSPEKVIGISYKGKQPWLTVGALELAELEGAHMLNEEAFWN